MTDELQSLRNLILVGAVLFGLGAAGMVVRRSMLRILLSWGLMLQGGVLLLVGFGQFYGTWDGQSLALFALGAGALSGMLGLGVMTVFLRRGRSLDMADWHRLQDTELADEEARMSVVPTHTSGERHG